MTPEGAILKSCLDYLAAKHILAFRMNTGAMAAEHNGKKRFMRFGTPGMADILAFPKRWIDQFHVHGHWEYELPCWIECKTETGRQSELQKSFQKQVEENGHRYLIARGVDDLITAGL